MSENNFQGLLSSFNHGFWETILDNLLDLTSKHFYQLNHLSAPSLVLLKKPADVSVSDIRLWNCNEHSSTHPLFWWVWLKARRGDWEITLWTKADVDIEPLCRVSPYCWPTRNSLYRPRWLQAHHLPVSTSQGLELRFKPPCPAHLAFVTSCSSGEKAKGDPELLNFLSLLTKDGSHRYAISPGFYGCSCYL